MTFLMIVHLLGLVIGLFSSGFLGVSLVGGLVRSRISHQRLSTIKRCTELDLIALLMTASTGATLLAFDAHSGNWGPKLWVRSIIVLVVFVLAISAKKFTLPLVERNLERSLSGVPAFQRHRKFLVSSRVLAFLSWLSLVGLVYWQSHSVEALVPVLFIYAAVGLFCFSVSPWAHQALDPNGSVHRRLPLSSQRAIQKAIQSLFGFFRGAPSADARDCEALSQELLRHELESARRHQRCLTVATLQSESLSEIRERYGGMAAEQFEKEVHSLVTSRLREIDLNGSLGRGKYLLILPNHEGVEADRVIHRLSRALDEYRFDVADYAPSPGAELIVVGFTLKVVTFVPSADTTPRSVLDDVAKAKSALRGMDLAS